MAVEFGHAFVDGSVVAAVDFSAAIEGLESGRLPCSSGEGQMLRLAAGIAEGVPLDLGAVLSGLDERNIALVVGAVVHVAGYRDLDVPAGFGGRR